MTHRIAGRARTGFGAKTGRNPAAEMAVAGEYLMLPTALAQLMLGGPWPASPCFPGNRIFLPSPSPPESSLWGGWVFLIGEAQLPTHKVVGSPDVGRKNSCWSAQESDRWLYSAFYFLKAMAKLPSKEIALVYTPTNRI